MASNKYKLKIKCSSCCKIIQEGHKHIICLTCNKLYRAESACTKSFDSNINQASIDMCQNSLADIILFQTLDDLEYKFTIFDRNNLSEDDMDRLKHLKFNPFDNRFENIALSENKAHVEKPVKNNCEYYLRNDFKKLSEKADFNTNF